MPRAMLRSSTSTERVREPTMSCSTSRCCTMCAPCTRSSASWKRRFSTSTASSAHLISVRARARARARVRARVRVGIRVRVLRPPLALLHQHLPPRRLLLVRGELLAQLMQLGLLPLVTERRDGGGRLVLRGDALGAHALQVAHALVEVDHLVRGAPGAPGRRTLRLQPDAVQELLLPVQAHLEGLEDGVVVDVDADVHDRGGGGGLEVIELGGGRLEVIELSKARVRVRGPRRGSNSGARALCGIPCGPSPSRVRRAPRTPPSAGRARDRATPRRQEEAEQEESMV
eukprot:scaffold44614_cov54-Phaeocystis_antarctica.AAC.3